MAAASLDEAYLDVSDYCATHGITGQPFKLFPDILLDIYHGDGMVAL